VIVRVHIVEEAWQGHLFGTEPATLFAPLFEHPNAPAGSRKVGAQRHSVVTGADDDRIECLVCHVRFFAASSLWASA